MNSRINEMRSYHGITQRELARRVGISSAAMSAIEREAHMPNVITALRIARELGTTVEELWGDKREAARREKQLRTWGKRK